MGIGTAAYNQVRAQGYTADALQQDAVDQFLGSIPAAASAAQKSMVAQKFVQMILNHGPYPIQKGVRMNPETAAAIADALGN